MDEFEIFSNEIYLRSEICNLRFSTPREGDKDAR